MHILLVDDDQDDRMFFEEALDDLDIDTSFEHAADGIEALKKLTDSRERIPDLVFLDLNMPVMTGRECLERIRQVDRLKDLAVVIYSTSFDPATLDLLYDFGAYCYVRKPGAYSELKCAIATTLKSLGTDRQRPVSKNNFVIYS